MSHVAERFILRLCSSTPLLPDDILAIQGLPVTLRKFAGHASILRHGARPTHCCLVVEGVLCRSKTTQSGKRQILSMHIPGDVADLEGLHLNIMDHDLTALAPSVIGLIPHDAMRAVTRSRPLVAEALWRSSLIEAAMFREWIINVGRRSAASRLAHLLTEMMQRLAAVGLAANGRFELPMTQLDLADALGLSPVHVNRVVQDLRRAGLLELNRSAVRLIDIPRLRALADFDDLYLHRSESARVAAT